MKKTVGVIATLLALSFAIIGCDENVLFTSSPGHYEGFVAIKSKTRVSQTLVAADVKALSKQSLSINVQALRGEATWTFNITLTKPGHVDLSGQDLAKAENGCFSAGKVPNAPEAQLCFDGREISIDLRTHEGSEVHEALTLILDRADPTRRSPPEVPTEYTTSQLIERTITTNFANRVEFEHVIQARLNAQMAAALLIPHLSANTILGVVFNGFASLLHAVGDLIPFVFPSRWFAAKQAQLQAGAELDAFIIMRADAANISEGLSYTIERDTKIISRFETQYRTVTRIRDEILAKERLHLLPAGSSDDVTSILNAIEKSISGLRLLVTEEYSALAQAAGFLTPTAISGVKSSSEISILSPEPLDRTAITEVAVQRSYEINQIDTLIESARVNKLERYFSIIDPAGGAQAAIGFNLYAYFQVAPSQLRELAVRRDNLKSLLEQKAFNTYSEATQAIQAYQIATTGIEIQDRRVDRVLSYLRLGIGFSLADLVNAIQSRVQSDVDQVNAEYAYYVALSKINRLLFAGPYARLNPDTRRIGPGT